MHDRYHRKPPHLSREEWIAVIIAEYPRAKGLLIEETPMRPMELPVIRKHYEEKRDYVFGTQPPHKEYELSSVTIEWERDDAAYPPHF
jgi:nucleoside diphosphate kinase